MPTFTYKVRNQNGEVIEGTLEMQSESQAATHLDQLGYSVIQLSSAAAWTSSWSAFLERFQTLNRQQIIVFSRQLSTMIRAGLPLLACLNTIGEQTTHKKFKTILEDVRKGVQEGVSFSEALSKHPRVFSELFVSMVRVGETGGILDKVLDRLAALHTQEMETGSRVQAALTYPIVLVVVAFGIVSFIMVGVLPKFVSVFQAAEADLPLPTQIVLGASLFFQQFWLILLIAIGGGLFWFRKYVQTEAGKFKFHRWCLKVPLFGGLYSKIQISRFSRTLSTLTASGIPLLQALTVVEQTVSNRVLRRGIQDIRAAITEGSSLVEPFKKTGLFSPMVIQMISTGEKTATLDQMLEEISKFYEPEIEYTIQHLTALLEPFMLLAMGGVVAFIALSVLLPIFNLMKAFKG